LSDVITEQINDDDDDDDDYRFVRFSYCIGDQFIEPYGSFGSLPLLSYYEYCG